MAGVGRGVGGKQEEGINKASAPASPFLKSKKKEGKDKRGGLRF